MNALPANALQSVQDDELDNVDGGGLLFVAGLIVGFGLGVAVGRAIS